MSTSSQTSGTPKKADTRARPQGPPAIPLEPAGQPIPENCRRNSVSGISAAPLARENGFENAKARPASTGLRKETLTRCPRPKRLRGSGPLQPYRTRPPPGAPRRPPGRGPKPPRGPRCRARRGPSRRPARRARPARPARRPLPWLHRSRLPLKGCLWGPVATSARSACDSRPLRPSQPRGGRGRGVEGLRRELRVLERRQLFRQGLGEGVRERGEVVLHFWNTFIDRRRRKGRRVRKSGARPGGLRRARFRPRVSDATVQMFSLGRDRARQRLSRPFAILRQELFELCGMFRERAHLGPERAPQGRARVGIIGMQQRRALRRHVTLQALDEAFISRRWAYRVAPVEQRCALALQIFLETVDDVLLAADLSLLGLHLPLETVDDEVHILNGVLLRLLLAAQDEGLALLQGLALRAQLRELRRRGLHGRLVAAQPGRVLGAREVPAIRHARDGLRHRAARLRRRGLGGDPGEGRPRRSRAVSVRVRLQSQAA